MSVLETAPSLGAKHRMVPLSDLAEINPSRTTIALSPETDVSFIPMGDTTESGRWINRQSRKYSEVRQGFTYFEEGDILFAKITPCMENGKGCLAIGLDNAAGFGSTEFHVLRAREGADAGFIFQWSTYQELRRQARNSMTGSAGQQRVPKEFFDKFLILELAKPEQTKIAEILSTVDRAIEQNEALIAKQQRIKTGLMQDLLTRGIDEHGNLRSEQTHEFKDSPLGRIPVEWEARELRSYLTYLSYGFTNPMPEAKDGPYMVTAANVTNGVVEYDKCRRTTVEAYDKLLTKKSRPEMGDILITKDGTLGRLAIVDRLPLCINQSVAVMRPKDEVDNIYLKLLLESPECQKRILDDSGGSTIKHIYISKIDKMVIGVPKKKTEQKAIKERLLLQYGLLDHYEWNYKKLRALKTALMQDLLTGKKLVRVLVT